MISESLFRQFYGERGNLKYNGTAAFYGMVREQARADARVLNLGAGPASGEQIKSLKGEVRELVGADIDPIVLTNDELDSALVIENGTLPVPDASFDMVFSDYVLEHVEHPVQFLSETWRVLKPGGTYLFRTPNFFHYVTLISYMTPHWFHSLVANRVRSLPKEAHEPWPTFYRLNSRGAVKRAAERAGFRTVDLRMVEYEPSYLMFHTAPFLLGVAYERLVNRSEMLAGLRANIFGRLIK